MDRIQINMPSRKSASPDRSSDDLPWLPAGGKRAARLPVWLPYHRLPPLICGASVLTEVELAELITHLKNKLDFNAMAETLAREADAVSLDHFLAAAFELWREAGAKSPDRWIFLLTAWGGEACAACLGHAVRQWAKELNRFRADEGIDFLKKIGLTSALMEISHIALTTKRASVARKALSALEICAAERGLTVSQLEDRIVPDCGLDARGQGTFDFGPRQFRLKLIESLDLKITDDTGAVRDDLPKPLKSDDPVLAAGAVAKWKTMRKQLRSTLTAQSRRLELAMGAGRRWSWEEFDSLLVRHPVMRQLAVRLIWAAHVADGRMLGNFRVGQDHSLSNSVDQPVELPAGTEISLMHPIHLTPEELNQWSRICTDYRIFQPFEQLTRWTLSLNENNRQATRITRFETQKIDALSVSLEGLGWSSLFGGNAVGKAWPSSNRIAIIELDPGPMAYGMAVVEQQRVTDFYFVEGETLPPRSGGDLATDVPLQELAGEPSSPANTGWVETWQAKYPALPLHEVDERILSDAIRDVQVIIDRRQLVKASK